jgi:hypothetical protein
VVAAAAALVAAWCCAAAPAPAAASSTQLSILQDDAAFVEGRYGFVERRFEDAQALGVDIIRANVIWALVAPSPRSSRKPLGFDATNPNSPGYEWAAIDRLVDLAPRHGLEVMLTPTGWIPRWGSTQPSRCDPRRRCAWRPSARAFGDFVTALARRYRGRVRVWSVWNEPNLGGRLAPQIERRGRTRVFAAGRMYRSLWASAQRAIARHDPARRNSVLFGETAPVGSPIVLLRAALCLDPLGRPFRGRARRLQGCTRPARLPVAGFSHHPYTPGAVGSIRRSFARRNSAIITYLPRIHSLIRGAARARRIPRRVPIWSTEFGFQTRPPDNFGLRPAAQATALNEGDRLFASDRNVRAVTQYLLIDDFDVHVFNTGLRFADLSAKPSFSAYRLPLVVTRSRRSRDVVEIWGWVRPARSPQQVVITNDAGQTVAIRTTNSRGQFTIRLRRSGAARRRYRMHWATPTGEVARSRLASPGAALGYRR